MGQLKQMHIDCYDGECYAPAWAETCYKQRDNVSYTPEADEDTPEQGKVNTSGDYDPTIDNVDEPTN
jgi:hypothetical protein